MADVETLYNEAMAAWRRGEIDDYAVLERVGAAGEDDPRTLHALGWVHRERGGCGAADDAFTRALVSPRYANDAAVWEACGDARAGCGRFQAAVDAYRRARELAPDIEGLAERLDDARKNRRGIHATWLAGTITVTHEAGVDIDCVPISWRHAAVIRTRRDPALEYVTIHKLPNRWDGDDEVIHDQEGRWVAAAPGGYHVAIGTRDETTIYDVERGTAVYLPWMRGAAWVDADHLYGVHDEGELAVWRRDESHPVQAWQIPAPVNGLELLPGGRFALCHRATTVELYDLKRRTTPLVFPLAAAGAEFAVSPDEGSVAVLTATTLTIWDRHRARRVVERAVDEPRRGLAFWPDDGHLLTGGERVELWDVESGRRRHLAALRGRVLPVGQYAYILPEGRPDATTRLITRIRLGTLPPRSPTLTPPLPPPPPPPRPEQHPLFVDRPPPRDPLPTAAVPHLVIIPPDAKPFVFPLADVTTIGASPDCNLRLATMHCSRQHCRVTRTPAGFVLVDLASTRGTIVNDRILRAERLLEPGDVIVVGDQRLIFGQGGANS